MAISGPHGEGGGVFADINITPLTDIFLVLLIIFMVTTSVTIESAAHVDLPNASCCPAYAKRWARWMRRSSCSRATAKYCWATWCEF
jgi:biopolymer transport protein ExbD